MATRVNDLTIGTKFRDLTVYELRSHETEDEHAYSSSGDCEENYHTGDTVVEVVLAAAAEARVPKVGDRICITEYYDPHGERDTLREGPAKLLDDEEPYVVMTDSGYSACLTEDDRWHFVDAAATPARSAVADYAWQLGDRATIEGYGECTVTELDPDDVLQPIGVDCPDYDTGWPESTELVSDYRPAAPAPDAVNPAHYCQGRCEVIVVTRNQSFNEGNATKYLARAAHKGTELEDLRKARWYLNDALENEPEGLDDEDVTMLAEDSGSYLRGVAIQAIAAGDLEEARNAVDAEIARLTGAK